MSHSAKAYVIHYSYDALSRLIAAAHDGKIKQYEYDLKPQEWVSSYTCAQVSPIEMLTSSGTVN